MNTKRVTYPTTIHTKSNKKENTIMMTSTRRNSNISDYDNGKIPLFEHKEAYDRLAITAMKMAIEDALPLCLEYEKPETICVDDIKSFSKKFREDTGLSCMFFLYVCENCDRLHCHVEIDYPDTENEEEKNDDEEE